MSFSEKVKSEIINIKYSKCCTLSLRYGELSTEKKDITIQELKKITKNNCCKKSYIKGLFLGSGSIADPNIEYHFEVSVKTKPVADYVINLLEEFNIEAKYMKRNKDTFVIYIKDSEKISTILAILGANNSLLEFENIRVEKEIKNDINRNVNCETANISKIINSSYKQIKAIEKIKENNDVYISLNNDLKELCELRLKYPNNSLEELKEKYSYQISKSGLYHKIQKIMKIAKEL